MFTTSLRFQGFHQMYALITMNINDSQCNVCSLRFYDTYFLLQIMTCGLYGRFNNAVSPFSAGMSRSYCQSFAFMLIFYEYSIIVLTRHGRSYHFRNFPARLSN